MTEQWHQKSTAYHLGHQAYRIWCVNPDDPRPENPYDPEHPLSQDWQQGWDDASIDI